MRYVILGGNMNNKEIKPTWNYILNDIALSSLITRNLYSESASIQDKKDLEYQIELIQQENQRLQQENNQLKQENLKLKDTLSRYQPYFKGIDFTKEIDYFGNRIN